jgi:hypothetical protein
VIKRLATYFDEDYPNAFIGYDEGRRVADCLVSRGFVRLDASQLEDWMRSTISQEIVGHTAVVFAMDVIPETILGDVDGNVLFRRYLDSGGRVIWVADVPAWYKGKPGRQREEIWQLGSFVSLLGIAPVIANCVRPVELTSKGREVGLRSTWYSMRPILVKKESLLEYSAKSAISGMSVDVLAWTAVTVGTSVIRMPAVWSSIRSFSVGLQAVVGGQVTVHRNEGTRLHKKCCASAWHIVFNENFPHQGFFRIWDHPVRPQDLAEQRLQEIEALATRNLSVE